MEGVENSINRGVREHQGKWSEHLDKIYNFCILNEIVAWGVHRCDGKASFNTSIVRFL
jgi:hypothetical protein